MTQNNRQLFDVPFFIVDALKQAITAETAIVNGTHLLIGEEGARVTNNANEIDTLRIWGKSCFVLHATCIRCH